MKQVELRARTINRVFRYACPGTFAFLAGGVMFLAYGIN